VSLRSIRGRLDRLAATCAPECRTYLVSEGEEPPAEEPHGPGCRCVAIVLVEEVVESDGAGGLVPAPPVVENGDRW
jgi:hypothetical protein